MALPVWDFFKLFEFNQKKTATNSFKVSSFTVVATNKFKAHSIRQPLFFSKMWCFFQFSSLPVPSSLLIFFPYPFLEEPLFSKCWKTSLRCETKRLRCREKCVSHVVLLTNFHIRRLETSEIRLYRKQVSNFLFVCAKTRLGSSFFFLSS